MEQVKAGDTGGGSELVAGETVAVKKGFELLVLAEEGIEYFLRGQRGGHGQVTPGQPFGEA